MTFSSDYRADIITETLVSVYARGGDGEAPEAVSVVEGVAECIPENGELRKWKSLILIKWLCREYFN